MCKDGKINTDGSDLLDIRFNEESPCVDYFEQCCETGDVLPPSQTTPPPKIVQPLTCGLRNVEGVGFRITGNNDNEAEYGVRLKIILKLSIFVYFICLGIPMDGGNS